MPSFDISSKVNDVELRNGVDIAMREIDHRYDFKDSKTTIELVKEKEAQSIVVDSSDDYKLGSAVDVLREKLAKRGVDMAFLDTQDATTSPSGRARQVIKIKSGINKELGATIIRTVKDAKLKVQVSIQGDELRVTGKKKDDLQEAMAVIKASGLTQPVTYGNFRD